MKRIGRGSGVRRSKTIRKVAKTRPAKTAMVAALELPPAAAAAKAPELTAAANVVGAVAAAWTAGSVASGAVPPAGVGAVPPGAAGVPYACAEVPVRGAAALDRVGE